jgi:hypothetical protein
MLLHQCDAHLAIIVAISVCGGLGFAGGGRRDDDPFGAALAGRLMIANLHALAFVRRQLGRFDRFRSLTNRGAALQKEPLFAVRSFYDELAGLIVNLLERPDHRSLRRRLPDCWFGRVETIDSFDRVSRQIGGTNRTRHYQYGSCNR